MPIFYRCKDNICIYRRLDKQVGFWHKRSLWLWNDLTAVPAV